MGLGFKVVGLETTIMSCGIRPTHSQLNCYPVGV